MLAELGGLGCGLVAGAAARSGRLCTMSAIEDAIVARDFRGAKAWGLALAIAILATQALAAGGWIDLGASSLSGLTLDWVATLAGGALFGLGMALAGTCSFGLLVRIGGGDLRALISAAVVGVAAFAFTAGALQPLRTLLTGHAVIDVGEAGAALSLAVTPHLAAAAGLPLMPLGFGALVLVLALPALVDRRVRRRRRLIVAAFGIGLAVAAGWAVTMAAVERLEQARVESLSFVAPAGRLLLALMGEPLQFAAFGVATVVGTVLGATAVALWKDEVRWEAFDDAREMRRHLAGAILMGLGGVLARGCTIGQGMTAGSALAVSAPVAVLGFLIGAKIGLVLLLEGRGHWRLGT